MVVIDCPRCHECMLTPCGYLTRACLLRPLRRLEISMCSRPRVGTDAREPKRKGFSSDINRGYNRVCRHGPRSRPSHVGFQKTSFFRKVQVVCMEVPDFGYADFQRLRTTSPPLTVRFGVLAAGYIPERGLRSDELVSVRRRRKWRESRSETSSSRGRSRSRL